MAANSRANTSGWPTGGLITPTQANTLDTNGAQSVNRNSTASGVRLNTPIVCSFINSAGTQLGYDDTGFVHCFNTAGVLHMPLLELPHGHTLTAVALKVAPAGGHVAQPAQMFEFRVYKVNSVGTATLLGAAATHTWVDAGTYDAGFTLTVSGLAEVISRSASQYVCKVTLESGANSITGSQLLKLQTTMTIDHAYGGTDISIWV